MTRIISTGGETPDGESSSKLIIGTVEKMGVNGVPHTPSRAVKIGEVKRTGRTESRV